MTPQQPVMTATTSQRHSTAQHSGTASLQPKRHFSLASQVQGYTLTHTLTPVLHSQHTCIPMLTPPGSLVIPGPTHTHTHEACACVCVRCLRVFVLWPRHYNHHHYPPSFSMAVLFTQQTLSYLGYFIVFCIY